MAKRTKAQEGDRVRHNETGETGTIFIVYEGQKGHPPNYGIILDTGPRKRTLWAATECEWAPKGSKRRCQRCGNDGHRPTECPYGGCGSHLSEEARELLRGMGLDPMRVPAETCDAEDAYNGIRLMVTSSRKDVYQPLRRRVCEVDGLVVDGHLLDGDACRACGRVLA